MLLKKDVNSLCKPDIQKPQNNKQGIVVVYK